MAYIWKIAVLYLQICFVLSAINRNWMRKPTNSVSIRQSAVNLCANHMIGDFVEDPTDCRMFYLCVDHGDAVLASCPNTMLFNKESMLCDAADNVNCTNGTDSSANNLSSDGDNELNNIVTDVITYCATLSPQPGNDRIVYIGSSSSCSNYYICYYGRAILQECSTQLHWNALSAKCDLPERAQCTLEQSSPSAPSPSDSGNAVTNELIHCPAYGQHLYPHMKRCEFFIYCVKGHATLQQCPFYYFFDVVAKSCQWSRTAVCVRDLNSPRQKRQSLGIDMY